MKIKNYLRTELAIVTLRRIASESGRDPMWLSPYAYQRCHLRERAQTPIIRKSFMDYVLHTLDGSEETLTAE